MYNICLIGAGAIGSDKPDDLDSPKTEFSLTHAHALYNLHRDKKINWSGIVDTNPVSLRRAAQKWNCPGFISINEIAMNKKIDVFVVAVSTKMHYVVMKNIIELQPKIMICEKPFCNNLNEAQEISNLVEKAGIKIIVNYTRRFIKEYSYITNVLKNQKIYHAKLTYGRGFMREACHFIDLCNMWFGDFKNGKKLNCFGIPDFSTNDMTFPVHLSYEKCMNVFLCPVDGRTYSIFEIDILTDKGRMILSNSGATFIEIGFEKEGIYGNYNILSKTSNQSHIELRNALTNLYNSVLENNLNVCTDREALAVHRVYDQVLNNE